LNAVPYDYVKAHAAQSVPCKGRSYYKGGAETLMHKGVNGDWKDMLSPKDIEHCEQMDREKLGVDCAYWPSTGSAL
jgi:aryl sulfotransferase